MACQVRDVKAESGELGGWGGASGEASRGVLLVSPNKLPEHSLTGGMSARRVAGGC